MCIHKYVLFFSVLNVKVPIKLKKKLKHFFPVKYGKIMVLNYINDYRWRCNKYFNQNIVQILDCVPCMTLNY